MKVPGHCGLTWRSLNVGCLPSRCPGLVAAPPWALHGRWSVQQLLSHECLLGAPCCARRCERGQTCETWPETWEGLDTKVLSTGTQGSLAGSQAVSALRVVNARRLLAHAPSLEPRRGHAGGGLLLALRGRQGWLGERRSGQGRRRAGALCGKNVGC